MPSNIKRSTHSGPNSLECVRVKQDRDRIVWGRNQNATEDYTGKKIYEI